MGSQRCQLVSVIVPCYNAANYVAAAIDSVLNQGHENLQVIVTDDGSVDDSGKVIRRYGDQVEYICQQNGGISAARNTALERAKGDFIAFLDADDLWCENCLKARLDYLNDHADADYVYGRIEAFLSEDQEGCHANGSQIPETAAGRLAGSMLVRTEPFFRVGLFDTKLRVGETMDWILRAQEAGLRGHEIDQLVLLRRVHASNTVKLETELQQHYLRALRASIQRRKQAAD